MESRLRIPHTLGKTVPRERVLQIMRMDKTSPRFVTVVSAPAGSGKTTLLAHRGRQLQNEGECVAWLSLDPDDNDPFTLWSGVLGACARALSIGNGPLDSLAALTPPRTAVTPEFLAEFGHTVESLPARLWLILDDAHELVAREALDGVAKLLRSPPQNMKLMIGCRYDPPLPLARMVLNETALEIRAADLAFDRDETLTLLHSHQLHLDDQDVDLLLARTEGWAAGLKLAALSIARYDDPRAHLAQFAGDERPVAEYLVSEVLSHENQATRDLLLAVAVPERLTVELADELSGRSDAGTVLEHLAHDNVLVYREDGGASWSYRLHSLLRSYLLAELDRRDAEGKRALHAKVSGWFDRQGLGGLALDHATMSADWTTVARLLSRYGLRLVLSGEHRSVEHALRLAPVQVLDQPDVSLLGAVAALCAGDMSGARAYLERVSQALGANGDPRTRLLGSAAHLYRSRVDGARPSDVVTPMRLSMQARSDRPEVSLLATANRGMIRLMSGDVEQADTELNEALRLASRHHFNFLVLDCLSHLALSAAVLGDAQRTATLVREAMNLADGRGWSSTIPMVPVYLVAAWVSWESLDVDGADTMLSLAGAIDGDVEPQVKFSVEALQTYVDFIADRDTIRARGRLRRTWDTVLTVPLLPLAISKHCLTELQLAIAGRDAAWVDEVLARADTMLPDSADTIVLRALADLHRGRCDHARNALMPMLAAGRSCASVSADIAARLLAAHIADTNGQPSAAHDALVEALDRAAPRNARRDLATASERVTRLLSTHRGRLGRHEQFVDDVIDAMRANQRTSELVSLVGGEALTERELDLLYDLPSLLSLAEIADAHVVSLNTVKTHLKAIYRKLDVGSRREAVERARVLGLM